MRAVRPEEESDRRISLATMQAFGPDGRPGQRLSTFRESR